MAIGITGHPVFVAILKLPSWKGRSSSSLSPLFLVPSGKITDGYAVFHFLYSGEYGLQTFFDIFPVQKETVEIPHPVGKKRDRSISFLAT